MADLLERADIQGIILSGYVHLPWSAFMLLTIDPAHAGGARRWLGAIADAITTAEGKEDASSVNLALTATGLATPSRSRSPTG